MSLAGFLFQRASIARDAAGLGADSTGVPRPDFAAAGTGLQCRVVESDEELVVSSSAAGLVSTRLRIKFLAGADVRPQDMVTVTTTVSGQAPSTADYRVIAVRPALRGRGVHHLVAFVTQLGVAEP